jgi:hypothetical protein
VRIISKPSLSPLLVYTKCYSSFKIAQRTEFQNIRSYINTKSIEYDRKAIMKDLYTISRHNHVNSNIYKIDMMKLYNDKMVSHKTGRKFYDKLMSLPKLKVCPFCGVNEVEGLDHYLPESEFPTYSVLPFNLIASCNRCNKGKLTNYALTKNSQTLHPYYDNFTREQWLFARLLNTNPVSLKFYVNPPSSWSQIDKDRVATHFKDYKLAEIYALKAAERLSILNYKFNMYKTNPISISNELEQEYNAYKNTYLNSWETAMYQELYRNVWYCNGGYN